MKKGGIEIEFSCITNDDDDVYYLMALMYIAAKTAAAIVQGLMRLSCWHGTVCA